MTDGDPSENARDTQIWWPGPLDVAGFVSDSVEALRAAVSVLALRRGLAVDVTTTPSLVAGSCAVIDHLRVAGRTPQAWAPYSGFFRAADGWVRLHGNYPHHAAAVDAALEVSSREELVARAATLPAAEIEKRVTRLRGIATVVRSAQEWAEHPHARATAGRPWRVVVPGADRSPLGPARSPLAGVRVLDLSRVVAGPTCTQVLGCLGADVLRVDPPHRPELLDQYLSNGMGKRSVELDLRHEADRVRDELLPRADVVVLGYRPGALHAFGLDADAIAAERPDAVVASLSAWGEDGPWGDRRGFDSIVQAATGIADLCAGDDGRPGALAVQALDHATGHVLAAGVLCLLAEGRGGVVRASLLGAAGELLARPRGVVRTADLEPTTVTMSSPYGPLTTAPAPLLLDGRPLTGAVTRYGAARPEWLAG